MQKIGFWNKCLLIRIESAGNDGFYRSFCTSLTSERQFPISSIDLWDEGDWSILIRLQLENGLLL